MDDDEDKQNDDEDLKSDPISHINMQVSKSCLIPWMISLSQDHIANVLRQAYASNTNDIHGLAAGLSEQEKGTLRAVLTIS